ncbi:MAG: LuxR C-terminal-related transcriptional regulator [Chloroflexota bacterium]|nr:LuxR C-terminal-related transcriptional regulator [Chloroflexota bacterium]
MPQTDYRLLNTKLYPPRIAGDLVPRPRLIDKLTQGKDRRLTVVSAPAGYGKTTLVRVWLETVDRPYAWLSLDEQDSDLATFVSYIIAALRTVFPDACQTVWSLLSSPTLPEPGRLANIFLLDLERLPGSLALVLDDYHAVRSRSVQAFVKRLIQYLPARVHLVLIARSDPPLALSWLRGQRQLSEIRTGDLCFTRTEADALLTGILGDSAPGEVTALLEERTEGWAAGLQLAALSMQDSPDPAASARRFARSSHRMVTDYLVTEVLENLPEVHRRLLLRMSIVERFCASMCEIFDEPSETPGSGVILLETLWRSNLFLVALDDQGVWYRYHHLFRSLLRHRLRLAYSDQIVAGLHRRATGWFTANGMYEEAITHAVQAGEESLAAQLVEEHMHEALDQEDWRRLERWVNLLPGTVLQRPGVLVGQAFVQHLRYKPAAVISLVADAETGLEVDTSAYYSPAQKKEWLGAINVLRSNAYSGTGNPERRLSYAEAALVHLPPEPSFARGLAELQVVVGLQETGQKDTAVALARSKLSGQSAQANVRTMRLLLALGMVYFAEADSDGVQAVAMSYLKLALEAGQKVSIGWANFGLGWVHYQHNDLSTAETYFNDVIRMRYDVHGRCAVDSFTGLALTLRAKGRHEAAMEAVENLRNLLLDRGMAGMMRVAGAVALRLDEVGGNRIVPEEFLADSGAQFTADLWAMPVLAAARAFLQQGTPDKLSVASELLKTCRTLAEARHARRRLIEIGALETLLHSARGEEESALERLQASVLLGEAGGALRLFVDAGPGLRPYLEQLLALGIAPAYVRRILDAYRVPASGAELLVLPQLTSDETRPPAAVSLDLLTYREIDVLFLLDQRLTNKEIAARLTISPRTVQKHTINIYRKLDVDGRRQAVAQARTLGLLPVSSSGSSL